MTQTVLDEEQLAPLELRVLTGLQSGAALPLDDRLVVGSDEEADLLLLDDGEQAPARLCVGVTQDGDLMLEAEEDGIALSGGEVLQAGDRVPLMPGDAFRSGDVWLAVRQSAEPWGTWTPPEMPTAPPPAPLHAVVDAAAGPAPAPSAGDLPELVADVRPRTRAAAIRASKARPVRTLGSVIVAAGLLSTMLGVAALVRQASDSESTPKPAQVAGAASAADGPSRRPGPSSSAASPDAHTPGDAAATASSPAASSAAGFTTPGVATSAPSVTSPLDLEGMAQTTVDRNGGRGRLRVNIPGDDSVILPFDIQEVLLGSRSHVILTDGRRLEPGDPVGEWRLAEIRPGALVFDGPRKVQIGW